MPLDDLLRQLADVLLIPPGQSGSGGVDRTGDPVPIAEGVPCLVRPLSALRFARNDQDAEAIDSRIYFAGDPLAPGGELTARHEIRVDGVFYRISGSINVNSMGRLLHVDCERLR